MALGSGKINAIVQDAKTAERLIALLGPLLESDVLWHGSPAYLNGLVQDDINTVIPFLNNGLTVQDVSDGTFALATIKNAIQSALPALEGLKKVL